MSLETLLTNVATNADENARTVDVDVSEADRGLLELLITKNSTVSEVEVTTWMSFDGSTFVRMTTRSFLAPGVATNKLFTDIFAITTSLGIGMEFNTKAINKLRFLFAFTNETAADKFSARISLA